jgi:hypothetical protein
VEGEGLPGRPKVVLLRLFHVHTDLANLRRCALSGARCRQIWISRELKKAQQTLTVIVSLFGFRESSRKRASLTLSVIVSLFLRY